MVDLIKRMFVMLMMVAFLLPATGMHFFVHHCTAMNYSEYSLDGSNSCCGKAELHHKTSGEQQETAFNAQACCSDASMLVKIEESYLAPESVPFVALFTYITATFDLSFTTKSIPVYFFKRTIPNVFSDWVWLTNLSIRL